MQQSAVLDWARERDRVWERGALRWGCVIAPPRELQQPGPSDQALLVLAADEPAASPELLHVIALRLADLIRQGATDPALSAFEASLQVGVQGLSVPAELGGTLPCRVYTVVAHRQHLPGGALRHQLLPLLVSDDPAPAALILPRALWEPRWRSAWERGFVQPTAPRRANARRVARARKLNERMGLLHHTQVAALGSVPTGVIVLPLLLGLASVVGGLSGLFLLASPLWFLLVALGVVLSAVGVGLWAFTSAHAPRVQDHGRGAESLTPDDAPELWSLVREVEGALDVMPIDRILIDRSFDCQVQDLTGAQPFASSQLVLVVGLPLLLSLSPTHFRALLIHALVDGRSGWAGINRRHRRHRAWVRAWRSPSASQSTAARTVARWLRDWAEVYEDVSAPLARKAQLRADRLAASHVGAQTFADALVRVSVLEGWWTTRWDGASFQGNEAAGPVPRPVARWRARGPELDPTMARLALTACLRRTDGDIARPSIGERLRQLGVRGRLIGDPPTVACNLLGAALLRLIDHVDDLFAVHFGETWRMSRHAAMRAHRRRDALASLAPARRTLYQHLELVRLSQDLDEPYLAAQHGLEVASLYPNEADARLAAGLALLEVGDDQGLAHLRAAIDLDQGTAPKACATAMRFLQERQMLAEMEAWGELWSRARGALSQETVAETPAIVVQGLAASSSG